VLVTVSRDGMLFDRRRVELVDEHLSSIPHHHEAQLLAPDTAVALVERVRISAEQHAALALDELASAVPNILGFALRSRPELPPTTLERIKDHRARNVADWVMYRNALASAAQARGWRIHWYDSRSVFTFAARALNIDNMETHYLAMRRKIGPPWNADHKLAMAAAVVAAAASL
jgi:hypothetical protein